MDINNLRTVIVGGASGMARATAERIAAGGGKVAVLDRPGTEGDKVAANIGGFFFECDIMDFVGTEHALAGAVEALGGLDAAVNTAGGGIAMKAQERSRDQVIVQRPRCRTRALIPSTSSRRDGQIRFGPATRLLR